MRPLLLVYENEDSSLRLSQTDPSLYSEIKLIFKSGDGMLVISNAGYLLNMMLMK